MTKKTARRLGKSAGKTFLAAILPFLLVLPSFAALGSFGEMSSDPVAASAERIQPELFDVTAFQNAEVPTAVTGPETSLTDSLPVDADLSGAVKKDDAVVAADQQGDHSEGTPLLKALGQQVGILQSFNSKGNIDGARQANVLYFDIGFKPVKKERDGGGSGHDGGNSGGGGGGNNDDGQNLPSKAMLMAFDHVVFPGSTFTLPPIAVEELKDTPDLLKAFRTEKYMVLATPNLDPKPDEPLHPVATLGKLSISEQHGMINISFQAVKVIHITGMEDRYAKFSLSNDDENLEAERHFAGELKDELRRFSDSQPNLIPTQKKLIDEMIKTEHTDRLVADFIHGFYRARLQEQQDLLTLSTFARIKALTKIMKALNAKVAVNAKAETISAAAKDEVQNEPIPSAARVYPLLEHAAFPGDVIAKTEAEVYDLDRRKGIAAPKNGEYVVLVTPHLGKSEQSEYHPVATLAKVRVDNNGPEKGFFFVALKTVRITGYKREAKNVLFAKLRAVNHAAEPEHEAELLGILQREFKNVLDLLSPGWDATPGQDPKAERILQIQEPDRALGAVIDYFRGSVYQVPLDREQDMLEMSVHQQLATMIQWLTNANQGLSGQGVGQAPAGGSLEQKMAEVMVKRHERDIKNEDRQEKKIGDLETRVKNSDLPKEIKERALEEIENMKGGTPDAKVSEKLVKAYLRLPTEETEDNFDLSNLMKVLNEGHEGLDEVKRQLARYVADFVDNPEAKKGDIVIFVGPPGVGKTSIALGFAKALRRKFFRIALGGKADESHIRGHSRTYMGAHEGAIIRGISKAKSTNAVGVLDEIDKIGHNSAQGDPAGALLEVLDPEQNDSFEDSYLEVPFNVSKNFWIGTANEEENIPKEIRDRAEIIRFPGYTADEKLSIAKNHLLPAMLKSTGLAASKVQFTDGAIRRLIAEYTREAGVRELKRKLRFVGREIKLQSKLSGTPIPTTVSEQDIPKYLPNVKPFIDEQAGENGVGSVMGLAWTQIGGATLMIQAQSMPSSRDELQVTGSVKEVMKESIDVAYSLARVYAKDKEYGIPEKFFLEHKIHLHVPEGATPKDGPSAGVGMTTAIVSEASGRPVKAHVAMTGEVDLRGRVLRVGGIREKLTAAYNAGAKTVFIPKGNERDLEDLPKEVRDGLKVVPVEHVSEVLKAVLENAPPGAGLTLEAPKD